MSTVSGNWDTTFTIKKARIFDGESVISADTVCVENGRVARVGQAVEQGGQGETIDATGCTLLPGLIDSHTHILGSKSLKQALVFGVTTELDMGTDCKFAAEVKNKQAKGDLLDWADLFSAGALVTAPGGHGTEYGMKVPTITGPEEAQAYVDARISEGSDYIKIIYDDGGSYGLSIPTVSKETLAAVIRAARTRGKLSLVHVASYRETRDAIECGCSGLAHLFTDQISEADFGASVAKANAFVIPTMTVLESIAGVPSGVSLLAHPQFAPYFTEDDKANLKRSFLVLPGLSQNYGAAEGAVRQLKAAGVPILAGSDAPNFGTVHGASLHRELELLVQAGLSPTEALAAATSVPAATFGLTDRGRIETGSRADLLLVQGDPVADIRATRNIARIWKRGAALNRTDYLAATERSRVEETRLRDAPPPAGSESGLVSNFEDMAPTTHFGMGWVVSTDGMAGGNSTAQYRVVAEGASGSLGSLLIEGEVVPGYPFPWAGAMFAPGGAPGQAVNLSSKKRISFWAKGDGRTYRVMLSARSYWPVPVARFFVASREWKHYAFEISDFDGMDGHDLTGVTFAAGPVPANFAFQIDDVRFE
jgi:imidazolonepropionase-like amidohydrolase